MASAPGEGTRPTGGQFSRGCRPGALTRRLSVWRLLRVPVMKEKSISWSKAASTLAVLVFLTACSDNSNQGASAPQPGEPSLIEPNVRVGKVVAGMTVKQLVTQLGEPQRRTAKALEYTQLGFAVVPDSNGVLSIVMCGDVTGIHGPFVKAFTGRTKEGIGMFSTRDELLKAYGEPTESEKFPGGLESMKYQPLGMTFTLERGKVHHIIVRLGAASETNRSVTLEPAPAPDQK